MKYSFKNDYSEGCHPSILEALSQTNLTQQNGYGEDEYCMLAANYIKKHLKNNEVDVHFVSGGTQANLIVIHSVLKSFESVIAASSGHINVHEAGAIESTGHRIESIFSKDGKLNTVLIQQVITRFEDEHTTRPKLVYISQTTELGTTYSKKELEDISAFCRKNDLLLFMDGARIGSALTTSNNDLELSDIAKLVDIFYIGGTKSGALLGEAIVITNNALKKDFRFHLKQRGALMSKGRLIGIQFMKLFEGTLFFDLSLHANKMAQKISLKIINLGYNFLTETSSNQLFPILPNLLIEKLSLKYDFYVWQKIDDQYSAIRIVTSRATNEKIVDQFISDLYL